MMIEKLYIYDRERYRLVCDACGKSALTGAYLTEAKMRQAVKSAGIKLDFSASWRCEKCGPPVKVDAPVLEVVGKRLA